MSKPQEDAPFRPSPAADARESLDAPGGLGGMCGTRADAKPYRIERVSLTKRKGNVVAHAVVWFGPAWIRFRIVRTERGLCVFPPANPCTGPGGRRYYPRSAGVDEEDIRADLCDDILDAYEAHLARHGRSLPKPLPPREPAQDRVREALEALAETDEVDALETGRKLFTRLTEIVSGGNANNREILSAAKLLTRLIILDTDRYVA